MNCPRAHVPLGKSYYFYLHLLEDLSATSRNNVMKNEIIAIASTNIAAITAIAKTGINFASWS
ncbi:hypothetical protein [Nostoc sp.]|uniref:hypothetical protein n=1 Tax=Nostoc sp. TaxID=1180 RepID=UPI002FFA15EC